MWYQNIISDIRNSNFEHQKNEFLDIRKNLICFQCNRVILPPLYCVKHYPINHSYFPSLLYQSSYLDNYYHYTISRDPLEKSFWHIRNLDMLLIRLWISMQSLISHPFQCNDKVLISKSIIKVIFLVLRFKRFPEFSEFTFTLCLWNSVMRNN